MFRVSIENRKMDEQLRKQLFSPRDIQPQFEELLVWAREHKQEEEIYEIVQEEYLKGIMSATDFSYHDEYGFSIPKGKIDRDNFEIATIPTIDEITHSISQKRQVSYCTQL